MGLIEIMEFRLKKDVPIEEVKSIVRQFKISMEKIAGIKSVDFILAEEDLTVLWQIIRWQENARIQTALSVYFQLPEMNLFTEIIVSPPRRINNFKEL